MTVIRTKTPQGEPIVILPEAEFERLRELAEDAADADIVARSQAALARGDEELLGETDLDTLARAPAPLAFWRRRRGLSESDLAARGRTSVDDVRAMEAGQATGDLRVYRRLAEVLGVTVDDLVPAA